MLLILIVAAIATSAFYREAIKHDIHPGKAASFPLVGAGVTLMIGYALSIGITMLFLKFDISHGVVRVVSFMADAFLIFAYLFFIRQNWRALTQSNDGDE